MAVSINDTPMCDCPRSTLSPERNVTPFPVSADFTRLLRLDGNKRFEFGKISFQFCLKDLFFFFNYQEKKTALEFFYLGSLGMEGMKDPVRL